MSSERVVITIDDDNVGNTTESQVQRLVRDLNEARTTIAYLRVDLSSSQAENARLQASTACESFEDDNGGDITESQVQRLEHELNSSRNTVTYLQEYFQAKITSLEVENTRVQAKYELLQVRYARLQDQRQAELLEDPEEDNHTRLDAPGNGERRSRRSRGSTKETRLPKRPRTQPLDSINVRRDLLDESFNNSPFDEHEETDEKITVRVNQDGELETDSHVDGQAWIELEDTWQDIKRQFDSKSSNWASIDLKKKCVWGTVISAPTTHYWTLEQPGNFACRSCANKKRICVGRVDGKLQLLPLPPVQESAKHKITDLLSNFVTEEEWISRRAVDVWPR